MQPGVRKNLKWAVPVGIVGAIVIGFLILCFRTVGVGQVGILTSFGHIVAEEPSGVVIKAPWPFQVLTTFDSKTQIDTAEAAAASKDLQDVHLTVATNYHLNPAKIGDLYRTVGTQYKERIIDPAIQESVKAATAQYDASELITRRPELKAQITDTLTKRLAQTDLVVDAVSITNIGFSSAYSQAIENKQVAQQQAEQAQFNLQKAQVDAQANAVQQAALTPEILQKMAIDKWDGHLPQATGSTPFINIK